MFQKANKEITKVDKILNNSYNTGNITYDDFVGDLKMDPRVSSQYEEQSSDDITEVRNFKMLYDEIYELFLDCPYYNKYKNPKRIDKNDRAKMYYYFKERLTKGNRYTNTEIFIGFAEFFQDSYDQLYTDIGVLDKEGLLKEINEKYNVTHKIASKRLF